MSRGPAAAWVALPARAVVFDLDGTLVDSFAAITASLNHARTRLGHARLELGEVRGLVGWGLDRLLAGTFPEAEREPAGELYRRHHADTALSATAVLPGVRDALAELRQRGLGLGVATNKGAELSRKLLEGVGLLRLLDVVIGAGEGAKLKPDPEMLEQALAALGAVPGEAVYVGDMEVDVATGRAAGVRVIAVATGACGRPALTAAGADLVLDGMADLASRIAPISADRSGGSRST